MAGSRLEDPDATEEEKNRRILKSLLDQNKRAARALGSDFHHVGYVSKQHAILEEFAGGAGGIF